MKQTISGWGAGPGLDATVERPGDLEDVRAILGNGEPLICRGAGRSYGDAAVATHVLDCIPLKRLLAFDESTGLLRAQGGVTIDDVIRFALPRGWFPPVTPGTKFPTLAGCVAADIHGKNHHAVGSLSSFVEQIELLLADGQLLVCSREQHADVFWASLGGMGLTGVIYSVTLRLLPVQSSFVDNVSVRTTDLADTIDVLRQTQDEHPYSVAWIDALRRKRAGRGLVLLGQHTTSGSRDRLHQPPRWTAPALPTRLVRRSAVRLVNWAKYRTQWRRQTRQRLHYDPYFYPLDHVAQWNRLYGRDGFLQFQFAVPFADAQDVIADVLQRTRRAGDCALAVLKSFGDHPTGPLGFPMPGLTLALDFARTPKIVMELQQVTDDVIGAGGRVYLAKDALTTPEQLERMYPHLQEFRRIRTQVDPQGRFRSHLSDRLGLS